MIFEGSMKVRDLETQYHIALPEDPRILRTRPWADSS